MALHSAAVQLGSDQREAPLPPDAPFYKHLWRGWQRIARALGNLLSRIVTTIAYFAVIPWFSLFVRGSTDPLDLKPKPSRWHSCSKDPTSIEEARHGF